MIAIHVQINANHVLKELNARRTANQEEVEVTVDAVIVGSGCGGGVMAYDLVNAGYTVLVLDKEGYYNKAEFQKWRESDALERTFDKAALMSTEDANFAVFAGSCVGGGSVINWSASIATPSTVLEDWHALGLDQFDPKNTDSDYAKAMREIHELFQINTNNSYRDQDAGTCATHGHDHDHDHGHDHSHDHGHGHGHGPDQGPSSCNHSDSRDHEHSHDHAHNGSGSSCGGGSCGSFKMNENNRLLWRLSERNGYTPEPIPRNVRECVDCGHCCYGCSHGQKNTTPHLIFEPFLLDQHRGTQPATRGKLYIIPFCYVDEVVHIHGKATGVRAHFKDTATATASTSLRVHATVTVAAAGAIQTPALLLRSRFQHGGIGRGLTLHPVVPVAAVMTKDIDTGLNRGVSMGVIVRQPRIFTSSPRFGIAIQTPPAHTAITSTVMPWQGSLAFKMMMLAYRQSAVFIGISRDRSQAANRVAIDADGAPVIHYRMTDEDNALVMQGLEVMLRLFYSEPRTSALMVAHASFPPFVRHQSVTKAQEDARFEAYVEAVKKEGIQPLRTQMYSAHQMSTVRMARRVEDGPVTPTGALFECDNVFVADGSVLPTALGINPMITIESMSHMIAQHVVRYLQQHA